MKAILAVVVTAGALVSTPVLASADMAKAKNCMACHAVDKKLVGPSYKDVATKYAAQADAVDYLAKKIKAGGAGVWGPIPMPPNANVNPDEAKALATWVLSLK
jgi:cytochrome c